MNLKKISSFLLGGALLFSASSVGAVKDDHEPSSSLSSTEISLHLSHFGAYVPGSYSSILSDIEENQGDPGILRGMYCRLRERQGFVGPVESYYLSNTILMCDIYLNAFEILSSADPGREMGSKSYELRMLIGYLSNFLATTDGANGTFVAHAREMLTELDGRLRAYDSGRVG